MSIRRIFRGLAGALLLAATATGADPAANWPHWRGPHLNGTSTTAQDLAVQWSETENVRWRTQLPSWAAATPVVWEDLILVTSAEEGFSEMDRSPSRLDRVLNTVKGAFGLSDSLLLLAINRNDGSTRWSTVIGEGNEILNKQNMASPTPVTDGHHIWVITGTGSLSCLDFEGQVLWQRNLQEDYGEFGLNFGYASSPVLEDGRLYLQVLHGMKTDDPSYLLAIDPSTGKTLWKVERPTDAIRESPDSYSTPMLADVGEDKQLIVSGGDYLTGHDLKTGRELWRAGGLNPQKARNYRTIASSLVAGDIVFAPSRRKPFIAFRVHDNGKGPQRLWSTDYGPDVPTPTTDGERLYIVDDKGIALCLDNQDGSIVWDRNRLEPGTYSASPVLADGKIYATNESGTTTVFRAGPEFEILAVNKLNDYTLASPAVAGKEIFLRTSRYLYCISKKSGATD